MKTLKFSNKTVASAFQETLKVEGSIKENEDGSVSLSYVHNEPCCEKSACPDSMEADMKNMAEGLYKYFDRRCSYINERMDDLWRALFEHKENGHLPKVNGAEQMKKAVEALGLSDEYEVQKKRIYASCKDANGKVHSLELEK